MSAPCDWWLPSGDQQQTFIKCVCAASTSPSPLSYPDIPSPFSSLADSSAWPVNAVTSKDESLVSSAGCEDSGYWP